MSLPSIRVSLPLLVAGWCIGAGVAGMWPLLIYPAMWAGVAGLLYALHLATGAKATNG